MPIEERSHVHGKHYEIEFWGRRYERKGWGKWLCMRKAWKGGLMHTEAIIKGRVDALRRQLWKTGLKNALLKGGLSTREAWKRHYGRNRWCTKTNLWENRMMHSKTLERGGIMHEEDIMKGRTDAQGRYYKRKGQSTRKALWKEWHRTELCKKGRAGTQGRHYE